MKLADDNTKISEIKRIIKDYCDKRDWDQFHSAKNLAIALSCEASEVLEPLRFKSDKEIEEMMNNKEFRISISEEMADVLYFLLRLSQRYNIDISNAFEEKMKKNELKYPVEKSKGSNKKYTEF